MMLGIRAKRWWFANYWWVLLLGGVTVFSLWIGGLLPDDWQIPLTLLGTIISAALFTQKQKLDELNLFRELFSKFNEQYDKQNNDLQRMAELDAIPKQDRQKVVDYFNFCAEEYWWYREGYIPRDVWGNWCRGMMYYLEKGSVSEVWGSEQKTDSYYGLTLDMIKAGAKIRR